MPTDPRQASEAYLEQHRICQLFEAMTAQLLFHKPENPKQFLIRALEAAKTQQGTASLLTESDFRTMYHMFDLTKRGAITREQAQAALKSVMGPTASFEKWQIDVPELLREDVFVSAMLQATKKHLEYEFSNKGLLPRPGAKK